jgi:Zn finger protein HypA/HybF involved in hydrogenase expression
MSAHDRHLAGYRSEPVAVECRECGHGWDDCLVTEYGMSGTETDECPQCGSQELDIAALDDLDISERKAAARGEDF